MYRSLEHSIRMIVEGRGHDAVQQFASTAHDEWRKGFDPEGSGKERVKKNSDGSEGNINVPFNKLHPDWQKENLEAGKAALVAVRKHPKDIEKASEHVHNEWMRRNPKADWNASQHVPYSELPDEEKEKDRVHVKKMHSILGTGEIKEHYNVEHSIRMIVESGSETEHRVGVTVSDPNHTMVSKRKETILKHVRVKAKSPAHAQEKVKAYFKKKGYRVHDTINATVSEDIGNSDKFVGNKQTDKPVPVIKPTNTQDAKTASLARSNAKERTSQTMGNNVEEETLEEKSSYHVSWGPGLDHEVVAHHGDEAIEKAKQHLISRTPKLKEPKYADTFNKKPTVHNVSKERGLQKEGALDAADTAAEYLVPYYSAGKKLYKGDRAGAAQDAAIDTALLATTGGVGKVLGGAARAGSKLLGGAVRSGEKVGLKAGEKAAITGAEKAGVSALEKDASKVAATDAEKTVAKTAAVDAEKAAGRVAATDIAKGIGKAGLAGLGALAGMGKNKRNNIHYDPTHHGKIVNSKVNTSISRAASHKISEESGDADREKDQAVPRLSNKKRTEIDYVGRPTSKRDILTRHGEITRKVIDEDSKKKANIIKDAVKKKSIEQNLDAARTKVIGDVIINPQLSYKNLNDVDSPS